MGKRPGQTAFNACEYSFLISLDWYSAGKQFYNFFDQCSIFSKIHSK